MALYLEQLEHQEKAITAVLQAMADCTDLTGQNISDANYIYANKPIRLKYESVHSVKQPGSLGGSGIDIKMETGTGKTYVYTRLMYELHRQFGLNKFVIMVPSLAIKEGAKSFIRADYTRKHFAPLYENTKIDLNIIEAGAFNIKKGRKTMSAELMDYLEGTRNEKNTIKALLINDAMLTSKSLTRDDYDQSLIGSTNCPVEGIRLTRPIVIIDEPHRFKKGSKAYQAILDLGPQLIIRLGATFPEIETGKGKFKQKKTDYENLVYNLGAVEAFNSGLVKAIDIHYPSLGDETLQETARYKVVEINRASDKKYVRFKRSGSDKTFEVRVNESLSVVDEGFEGDIELAEIKNADYAVLSNELEIHKGSELVPQVFSASYQELVIRQAIEKHFVKERENWFRENAGVNAPRIKTLSLYFIDSIASYRNDDGWLKNVFEKTLADKLTSLIAVETDDEYRDFLEYSLAHISEMHGGYFAEDNGTGDSAIQAEVDDILRNKESMTQFKVDGKWNIRRFLFSKWTLREGWDNPNVFVITKLRTSGSEISKLQEVGRGLRLPVDELGRRLANQEFRLDYMIDWTERDFASKLVGEINSDGGVLNVATNEIYSKLVEVGYASTLQKAKGKLLLDDIIDENDVIIDQEKLLELLPDGFVSTVQKGKVTSNLTGKKPTVKLRRENWAKIQDLWDKVSRRYMLEFERLAPGELQSLVGKVAMNDNFFTPKTVLRTDGLGFDEYGEAMVQSGNEYIDVDFGLLKYGEFLKRLSRRTSVPVQSWHQAISKRFPEKIEDKIFNLQTIDKLIADFQNIFEATFAEKYSYSSLDYTSSTSVLKNGELVDELEQGMVGVKKADDVMISDKFLYTEAFYDSELEHEVLKIKPDDKVIVYGKLPRRSIKVPTYTGGTTTPDFIYALDKGSGKIEVNLLIETKASDMRMGEERAVEAQGRLFANIEGIKWRKATRASEIGGVIEKLLKES